MGARSREQHSDAPDAVCFSKAASNMSILGMVWRNDSQKSCLTIARRGICQTQWDIERRKLSRKDTELKIGCVNDERSSASCRDYRLAAGRVRPTGGLAACAPQKICERDALTTDKPPLYS